MAVWKPCPPGSFDSSGPVLFLDRDGVVIIDRGYLKDPDKVELLPGVAEAMAAASEAGFLLIGVSNQSGLGRGLFTAGDLVRVMTRVDEILGTAGTGFDGFYYCPHAPEAGCDCRKPATGLLAEAGRSCRWDPARSWVVGDKVSDVGLGRNAGLGSVLVRTGYGAEYEARVRSIWGEDDRVLVADDLPGAIGAILEAGNRDSVP